MIVKATSKLPSETSDASTKSVREISATDASDVDSRLSSFPRACVCVCARVRVGVAETRPKRPRNLYSTYSVALLIQCSNTSAPDAAKKYNHG